MRITGRGVCLCVGVAVLAAMVSVGPVGVASSLVAQEQAPHWDYEEHGPATWG